MLENAAKPLELLPVIRRLPRRLDNLGAMLEKRAVSVKVGFFSDKTNASFVSKLISQVLLAFVGMAFGGTRKNAEPVRFMA